VAMTYQEEMTLHVVASRLAIGDLAARYSRAYDTGDLETWLGTFVPEAVFTLPDGQVFEGHRGLAEFFRSSPHDLAHLNTDAVVEVDGVHARQESCVLVFRQGDAGADLAVRFVGRYLDELVYERGSWYFVRREIVRDLS